MPLLECLGLTRRPWFDAFDLTLAPGTITTLEGPVGSGKTLLLRALADLDPVDTGRVMLDGVDRDAMRPCDWRAKVLYVHQTAVRLAGDVRANVARVQALAAHRRATPNTEARAGLAAHGLTVAPERQALDLSGGEAALLGLERALAIEPPVLLLDEPTASLDRERARALEATLQEWVRPNRAILWVTHEPELKERIGAQRISLGHANA